MAQGRLLHRALFKEQLGVASYEIVERGMSRSIAGNEAGRIPSRQHSAAFCSGTSRLHGVGVLVHLVRNMHRQRLIENMAKLIHSKSILTWLRL